jgi:hypothetical protein
VSFEDWSVFLIFRGIVQKKAWPINCIVDYYDRLRVLHNISRILDLVIIIVAMEASLAWQITIAVGVYSSNCFLLHIFQEMFSAHCTTLSPPKLTGMEMTHKAGRLTLILN